MEFIADFHIHSKYSRATSGQMDIEHLNLAARKKAVHLLGTGDFTHPLWLLELKSKLEPCREGIFRYGQTSFILTAEVCNIFYRKAKAHMIHSIIFAPDFKSADEINKFLCAYGDLYSDGRPMVRCEAKDMLREIKEINPLNFLVPAHIWTPHFSIFGANSGFDTVEECFGDYTSEIFALETGLSSDPAMNWRLSALDKYALISNSDAHSPAKIAREANVFSGTLNYPEIKNALQSRDRTKFLYTIEFFPEEGKYHYDGHRVCGVSLEPEETKKHNNLCPRCKKPVTVGVMHRVSELADREKGFSAEKFIPFKNLIPLIEIIAEAKGVNVNTKTVENEYDELVKKFGSEMNILLKAGGEELKEQISTKVADAILRVRNNDVKIYPGYDGEYGKIEIFSSDEKGAYEKQMTFF